MSRRRRAREIVLQILYQDDLNPTRKLVSDEAFLRQRLNNDDQLMEFAKGLLSGVRRNRAEIDVLVSSLANNWTMTRMAVTDRNVLRLGAYEILYDETPGRVAVNEAIELAKRYGSKQSAQFVNGILDRLLNRETRTGDK